jgi:hypothetical protein
MFAARFPFKHIILRILIDDVFRKAIAVMLTR